MKIIIVAGGQGTKLWPYSRSDKPKQFQPIIGDNSSYQEVIETLLTEFTAEDIFISTKQKFIKYVSEQSPQIPLKNYIVEPDAALDRGPGEGLAFMRLEMLHPNEPVFYVQADMVREPREKFIDMIKAAEKVVTETGRYVTGGLKATEPNMGADYLEIGESVDAGNVEAYVIDKFHYRKSTVRETRELVENFRVVTHWNHLCWYPSKLMEAYKQYRPDWYEALMKIKDAMDKPGEQEAIRTIYETMAKGPTEDVTRNIMDSGEAVVLLLPFRNTDVGTWESVRQFSEDDQGNHIDGTHVVTVDTTGTLVKTRAKNKLIAVAGVKDLIVVDSDDILLVIPRDDIDKIKELQALIGEKELKEYL
jgi:mannose-1-phosphate guanylyltransferase